MKIFSKKLRGLIICSLFLLMPIAALYFGQGTGRAHASAVPNQLEKYFRITDPADPQLFPGKGNQGNIAAESRRVNSIISMGAASPPSVFIHQPGNGVVLNSASILVSVSASGGTGSIASVLVNGQSATFNSSVGDYVTTITAPGEGPFTITVTATDTAGNVSAPQTCNVIVDLSAPVLVVNSPVDGGIVTTMPFNVTGTVTDIGGISSLTVNGQTATINGNTFTGTIDEICDGPLPITVIANDRTFHSTTVSLNVTVAVTARTNPCVVNIGPAGGSGMFVVDPNDPNTILTVGGPTQILKTVNGGAAWTPVPTGLVNGNQVGTIARNTVTPDVVYISVSFGGVLKSTTGGTDFKPTGTGLSALTVSALTVDPHDANVVYAGARPRAAFRTTDGGVTWVDISAGLPQAANNPIKIAVDPRNGNTLFMVTDGGVFKSTNRGDSWSEIDNGIPPYAGSFFDTETIAIDSVSSDRLYVSSVSGGIYTSSNAGTSWSAVNNGLISLTETVATNPTYSGSVYAGSVFNGIFKSLDAGGHWVRLSSTLASSDVNQISMITSAPDRVYVHVHGGGKIYLIKLPSDVTPPTITIDRPIDGSSVNSRAVFVAGHAIDNNLGTGVASVTVNGAPANFDVSSGVFSANLMATGDGPFQITVQATDNVGNVSAPVTNSVNVDTAGPTITIDSPADGASVNSPTITVSGTVGDSGVGVATVAVNRVPAKITGNTYTAILNAQCNSGAITIEAIAVDKSNNSASVKRNINVTTAVTLKPCSLQTGPAGGNVLSLAVDRINSGTLYAGTESDGIFKSIDNGLTWSSVNNGVTVPKINALVIDNVDSRNLYAGTSQGVFKTVDGGRNWTAVNGGLPTVQVSQTLIVPASVSALAVSPANSNIVYAIVNASIYKSTDGGANWALSQNGITPVSGGVRAIAVSPSSPDTIYAGMSNFSVVFKSTDAGNTWTSKSNGFQGTAFSLTVDPGDPQTVYAATGFGLINKTTDGGSTWVALRNGLPANSVITSMSINANTPSTIWAGTDYGVFLSTDGGSNWVDFNNRLPAQLEEFTNAPRYPVINAAGLSPSSPGVLYVATPFGVFKTATGAADWKSIDSGLNNSTVLSLTFDPVNPSTLYAVTTLGVFKSINRGLTWTDANLGLPTMTMSSFNPPYLSPVTCIAVDRNNPNVLYAGLIGTGVYKSIDGGQSWTSSNTFNIGHHSVSVVVIDPSNSNTIYAGHETGILKSIDGGVSWTTLQSIGPAITSVVIDPSHTNTIYVGSQFGMFKSTNGGSTWNSIQSGLPDNRIQSLTLDPSTPGTLYAGSPAGYGIFKSVDGGANWVVINNGIIGIPSINSLAVDPTNPNFIYAATSAGLYKGTSAGAKWDLIDTGFGSNQLNTLAIDPADVNTLYLGTSGYGIVILQQQKDVTAPSITITSPVDGSFTNNPRIKVAGVVKDNISGSGVSGVTVNGVAVIYDNTNDTFATSLTATNDGPFVVSVQATDNSGNVGTPVTSTVTLDRRVPAITIDSPVGGAVITTKSFTVTGTVKDNETGISSVTVNGVLATVNGNSYSVTLNTPCSQSLRLTAIAMDRGSNTAAAAEDVTITINSSVGTCWAGNGPEGGEIFSIAPDPTDQNVIYAGTINGVFKSTNGGVNWRAADVGLSGLHILSLAIDPTNPSILYAGTSISSIYKTTNAGVSWTQLSTPATSQNAIYSLVINPTNPSIVYAGAGFNGLLVSTDGGLNWDPSPLLPQSSFITAVTLDPKNPANVYAASGRNILRSTDGTNTWTSFSVGASIGTIYRMVIDSNTPSTLYVGSSFGGTNGGMFKSSDSGATWNRINTGIGARDITALAIDPKSPTTLYAAATDQLYRTVNGGANWSLLSAQPGGGRTDRIVVSPFDSKIVFVGTDNHFAKSIDAGESWIIGDSGMLGLTFSSVAVDPINSAVVYAGAYAGIYKSLDHGSTWSLLESSAIAYGVVSLVIDPLHTTTLYVGAANGLFKSSDGGASWTAINALAGQQIQSVAIDSVDTNIVYAGAYGVFEKTADGGQTWTDIGQSISFFPIVYSVVVDQTSHNKVYVSLDEGIFLSSNGGGTWTALVDSFGQSDPVRLALDPAHPGTIYSGNDFGALAKSIDDGKTWSSANAGLPLFAFLPAVIVDTANTTNLYLPLSNGVYRSSDGGQSWTRLTAILANESGLALALDPVRTNVLYQSAPGGVFRLEQAQPTVAAVPFLARLGQTSAQVGSAGFSLKTSGANFAPNSIAGWNGSIRPTIYVNSTTLLVSISSADLSTGGVANVTVTTNAPGGGVSNSLSFGITKLNAGLTVGNLNQIYDGSPKTVTVTTSPANLTGITVTYNGSNEPPINAGSYPFIASIDNPAYMSSAVIGTLVISKASQDLAFQPLSDKTLYDGAFQLNATASSGLPVTYEAQGGVSISGNTVTLTSAGSVTITAFQTGNNNYSSAQPLSRTFNINNPLPQILRLNPGAIIAGSGQTMLRVSGSNFVTDSLVKIDGVNSPATFVNRIEMDIALSATDLASPGTKTITITNLAPGGGNSIPVTLKIISITSTDTRNIQPGTTDTVSNAPTQSGDAGITAQLNHSQSAGGPATVTVEQYSGDPLGGSGLIEVGGGYVDLKVTGADPNDTLNATFYYGSNVTGTNQDKLQLLYFTGSKWAKVRSSGNTDPIKNTSDNQDGTVSGGTFTVVFDETSSPKLSQLTGTIFSSTPGLYGDLNNDQVINVVDLILMANFLAGNTTVDKTAGDLTLDGKLNVSDLIELANFLAGNVAHLPASTSP